MNDAVHLRSDGVSLVLDTTGPRLPRIAYWGADLGELDPSDVRAVVEAGRPPTVLNLMDEEVPVGVLPEAAVGWVGTPGLSGHRGGRGFSPLFDLVAVDVPDGDDATAGALRILGRDSALEVDLELRIALLPGSGLVRLSATLTNTGTSEYVLERLQLSLPIPAEAAELLDLTGRWTRERAPQRHAFTLGTHLREGRRGRTGTDATLLLVAGESGFGFRSGEAWAVHTAWSGNHVHAAERLPTGVSLLSGGELLLPGEGVLAPGESYTTPDVYGSHGHGLDAISARFHRHLRARPGHPRTRRPVVVNTWEAVYFQHDVDKLTRLADAAARVGAERFVLDDGWFRGRRHDAVGLGDWDVDPDVWPDGLHPLVDHVRGLGLEFGLWVEPEMISPGSALALAHPDWVMSTGDRLPPLSRGQQVLDLANPAAFEHIAGRLDALVTEYRVDYLKWDHNRDLVDGGHPTTGRAGVHDQTLAVYRLLDGLRRRHPGLEIESCSSGGGRVDLGVLERTDRVWASDCLDPLERQQIQRWTGLLVPPELVGAHVGGARAHTTGRVQDLPFRAITALFGHLGIEWDLDAALDADPAAVEELTRWVALHKRHRDLLHSGVVVRSDHPDPATWVHGVVSPDGAEALYAVVAMATSIVSPPGRLRLPGLRPDRRYRVEAVWPDGVPEPRRILPSWWAAGIELTGAVLATAGVQVPQQKPEQACLLHVTEVTAGTARTTEITGVTDDPRRAREHP
ncbi:alpha-galactosidase [Serinibacter arcticus]|uniref:alpha-galactosidase n=2 Tax=Serinibacter arcticus TaxID=1655435 RepID=A0A2U1ZYP0_9MICO|nr:alpha-galactosidase [Serinibacter arcticus]